MKHALKNISYFASVLLAMCFLDDVTIANPTGGTVVHGNASIANNPSNPNHLIIHQNSDKTIINWQSFNIGEHEHTQFVQPSSSSFILNRVTGGNESQILGRLSANGRVMLLNPAGIMFGPNSRVDVASIVATTANISNQDFLTGQYVFEQNPAFRAPIINHGLINVADTGFAALVAPSVANHGIIRANLGTVVMAAGMKHTMDLYGDGLINFVVQEGISSPAVRHNTALKDAIKNEGYVYANGGHILMTAKAAAGAVENVINMRGVAQANSVNQRNGRIVLRAGKAGKLVLQGTTKAKDIYVFGDNVIIDNALLDASSDNGGGFIETSGYSNLSIGDNVTVKAESNSGAPGEWFIDPPNLTIDQTAADAIEVALATMDVTSAATNTVTLTGNLNYTGVDAGTTWKITGANFTANGTIDGLFRLDIDSTNNTRINNTIGGITPLFSLTTPGTGTTRIGANISAQGSTITFNNNVLLTADTVITDTGSGIFFNRNLNGAFNLTVNAPNNGTIKFSRVGNGADPTSITTDSGTGKVQLTNARFEAVAATFNKPVELTTNINNMNLRTATFNSTIDGGFNLDIDGNNTGAATFNGVIGGITPIRELDVNNMTSIHMKEDINSFHQLNIRSPVILTGDVNIDAGRRILFFSTIDSDGTARNLTLDTDAQNIQFRGNVGSTSPLNNLTTSSAANNITMQIRNVNVTTNGAQTYNNRVRVSGDPTLTGSTVTFNNALQALNATATPNVTINGNTVYNSEVSLGNNINSLTHNGAVTVNTSQIETDSFQVYNGPVNLLMDHTMIAGDNILVFGAVAGPHTILMTSGGSVLLGGLNVNTANITSPGFLQAVNVNVNSLTISGMNGGFLFGSVAGNATGSAATLVTLAGGSMGDFYFNTCLIPSAAGCNPEIVSGQIRGINFIVDEQTGLVGESEDLVGSYAADEDGGTTSATLLHINADGPPESYPEDDHGLICEDCAEEIISNDGFI